MSQKAFSIRLDSTAEEKKKRDKEFYDRYGHLSIWKQIFLYYIYPQLTYFNIHVIYFVSISLFGALMIWGIEKSNPNNDTSYVDALFSATGASCGASVGGRNFFAFRVGSKIWYLILMELGGLATTGAVTAFVRQRNLGMWLHRRNATKGSSPKIDNLILCHEALGKLGIIMFLYNIILVTIGFFILLIYSNTHLKDILSNTYKHDPTWFAFFTAVAAYSQAGFGTIRDGLTPFNSDFLIMIVVSSLVIFGNTCLPLGLRFFIWIVHRFSKNPAWKFLLVHPRLCSFHIFPSLQTKILGLSYVVILTVQMVVFAALNFHYPVMQDKTGWHQFVLTVFQATNTRDSGFDILDLTNIHPAQKFMYAIFMLIVSYPYIALIRSTAIAVRNAKKIDELYEPDLLSEDVARNERLEKTSNVLTLDQSKYLMRITRKHVKETAMNDFFWIVLGLFMILCFESPKLNTDPNYDIFKIIFEVCSAYGNVGLSLGYPEAIGGFSTVWTDGSKLVMCAILLIGRHNGMPRGNDASIVSIDDTDPEIIDLEETKKQNLPISTGKNELELTTL